MAEFLVAMTTEVPSGTSAEEVADVRAREAAHTRGLAERGELLRLWRAPRTPGEWRSIGLFSAQDADELESVLAGMPLRIWRSDEVTPLAPHPNDPPPEQRVPPGSLAEFFVTFTFRIPPGTPSASVDEARRREAERVAELARAGTVGRLWMLPEDEGRVRALGLWRGGSVQEVEETLDALPMAAWLTVEVASLTKHPSDP